MTTAGRKPVSARNYGRPGSDGYSMGEQVNEELRIAYHMMQEYRKSRNEVLTGNLEWRWQWHREQAMFWRQTVRILCRIRRAGRIGLGGE